jgi:hypothetical protein
MERDVKLIAHAKFEANKDVYEWMETFQKVHDDLISKTITDDEVPIDFIFLDEQERKNIGKSNCLISYRNGEITIEADYDGNIDYIADLISHTQRYKDVPDKIGFQWITINNDEVPPKVNSGAVIIDKDNIHHRTNNEDWLLENMYGYPAPKM